MMAHLLLNRKSYAWDGRTGCMTRQGRESRYRKEYQWWWDQEGIDLEGERAVSGAAYVALEEEAEGKEGGV